MEFFWLLLIAGVVVLLQALVLGRRSLRQINYERKLSRSHCHVGDDIEMIEIIQNKRRIPVPWLRLESILPAGFQFGHQAETAISEGTLYQNHTSLFSLSAQTRITRTHQITCRQRGVFHMDSALMSAGDVFGLARANRPLRIATQMTVYPAYTALEDMPEAYRSWQGEVEVRRWTNEDPFLITGVREYSSGDPMNQIHWKATARTGQLQVYRQGYSADPEVMILFNIEINEQMWRVVTEPMVAEYGLSCCATIAADLIGKGMKAGFGHNAIIATEDEQDARILPAYGSEQLSALLQCMAEVQLKSRQPFHEFLQSFVPQYSQENEPIHKMDILIVTPHVSEPIKQAIHILEQSGSTVSILNVPDIEQLKKSHWHQTVYDKPSRKVSG